MSGSRYKAASIDATVEIQAFDDQNRIAPMAPQTQRKITVHLRESFDSTEKFHQAVDALAITIKEAATR